MRIGDDAMPGQCPHCQNGSWEEASFMRTFFDLLCLYFIGIYELVRQAVQHRLHTTRYLSVIRNPPGSVEETGYTAILSGATSGIGREIRRELHGKGIRLMLLTHPSEAGRFPENEEVLIDVSSPSATKRAAEQVRSMLSQSFRTTAVVFFHCAGIYNPCEGQRKESLSSGVEQTYAVNTVMPALFLQSVGDLLTSVIYIGSSSQKVAPTPSSVSCPFRLAKSPYAAYPLSKMLTLAYIERWSHYNRKLAIVIHPGVVDTNLYKNEQGFVGRALQTLVKYSALRPDESAKRVLQILDQTQFLVRTSKRQSMQHEPNLTGIFWDAATMTHAMLPHQIANIGLRDWLFQHISGVLDGWTDS